jgi:hypothetical protein
VREESAASANWRLIPLALATRSRAASSGSLRLTRRRTQPVPSSRVMGAAGASCSPGASLRSRRAPRPAGELLDVEQLVTDAGAPPGADGPGLPENPGARGSLSLLLSRSYGEASGRRFQIPNAYWHKTMGVKRITDPYPTVVPGHAEPSARCGPARRVVWGGARVCPTPSRLLGGGGRQTRTSQPRPRSPGRLPPTLKAGFVGRTVETPTLIETRQPGAPRAGRHGWDRRRAPWAPRTPSWRAGPSSLAAHLPAPLRLHASTGAVP